MKVTVLFFGATAESAGKQKAELTLEKNASAGEALGVIFASFPNLKKNHTKKSLLFAVNQEYAAGDEIIHAGDVLAVFTAVSGG